MRVLRFFVPEIPDAGDMVILSRKESVHARKVLRLGESDSVVLLDGCGTTADAVVHEGHGGSRDGDVRCLVSEKRVDPLPLLRLHLLVAPPRSKKMRQVVRIATELGVWRITPIVCTYSVSRPGRGSCSESWRRESIAALKQSGNPRLPRIASACDFRDAISCGPAKGYFGSAPSGAGAREPSDFCPASGICELALWIGPEGGFSEAEEELLLGAGYCPLTIGSWTLRVETAVPALLGCILGKHRSW